MSTQKYTAGHKTWEIQPACQCQVDVDHLSNLQQANYTTDVILRYCYVTSQNGSVNSVIKQTWKAEWADQVESSSVENSQNLVLVAIDQIARTVLGYLRMRFRWDELDGLDEEYEQDPYGINTRLAAEYDTIAAELMTEHLKAGTSYYELEEFFVHPNHGGNGIDRELLERALASASKEGLPFTTITSVQRKNVFEVCGFREVGGREIKLPSGQIGRLSLLTKGPV